jgi:beta-glucosidase
MYKNENLAPEVRAADLLSKMTLHEKILQMNIYKNVNSTYDLLMNEGEIEPRFGTFGDPNDVKTVNEIQKYCVEKTRLGIPMVLAFESLHGFNDPRATVFPQSATLGGSFDRDLIYKMADVIGKEVTAMGIRQVYAPDIDIPRDPRWGRMQECYGEDPYLVGEMGVEYVKGVQKHSVAATAKHFTAYGVPEGGINLSPTHMGEREIREITLEPFKKCIDAGVMSVMPAYNEVDGEPIHASKKYLRSILRDELGFNGTVVSDYGAIEMFKDFQHIVDNELEAGKVAIEAGVDIEAPTAYGYGERFEQAVLEGDVDIKLIDEAVLKILTLKFKLGLFENPYIGENGLENMHTKSAVDLALKAEEESILLLENDGILPLDESNIGTVAVVGNNAKDSFLGDYIAQTQYCVDFYSGIKNRLGENRVLYAQGCNPITTTDEMIEEAVNTAKKSDMVFLVLGDRANEGGGVGGAKSSQPETTCGEGYDMHDLDFPPSQRRLFDEIVKLGKPTVLILYAGRPYTIEKDINKVNAYMHNFGGGEQSGNAFANLIFGDKSPSAKLSLSFPKTVGHIPCHYNYKVSARGTFYKRPGNTDNPGRDYVLSSPNAWYPFGYGLSYTTVKYTNLTTQKLCDGNVEVTVNVENTGNYDINESVLLFVKTLTSPITPFVKKLRNFQKVYLKSGEKKTVIFTLNDDDFTYVDLNYKTVKLAGMYKIIVENLECDIRIEA